MPKPKSTERLPFKALSPVIGETHRVGYSLFQITPDKPGSSAAIEVCYDFNAFPNEMAKVAHNYKMNVTQANPQSPPETANHYWFRVNKKEALGSEFGDQAAEILAKNLVPTLIESIKDLNFKKDPEFINLYPTKDNERYLPWMINALGEHGIATTPVEVKTGGKKIIKGIAIQAFNSAKPL